MNRFVILVACVTLTACQSPRGGLSSSGAGQAVPSAAATTADGSIAGTVPRLATPLVSNGTADHSPSTPSASRTGERVSLNLTDTDVRVAADQVLGGILGVTYAIDPAVHGAVTFKSAKPVTADQVLPLFETLLSQVGATLVRSGDVYRVVPAAAAAGQPYLASAGTTGVEVIPLHYTSATDLVKVLGPVIGQNGPRIAADRTRNAILLSGEASARATVEDLIRAFDVDTLAGQSYALFPITSADDARTVAAAFQQGFQTDGDGTLAGVLRVIPMQQANAVLVVAPNAQMIADARRLFDLIERNRQATGRSWHVYHPRNAGTGDLAAALQRAFTPGEITARAGRSASGGVAPGLEPVAISAPPAAGTSEPTGAAPETTATAGTADRAPALADDPSSGRGASNAMRIIANPSSDAILIYSTADEQRRVDAMLRKIDVPPQQVRIDATVAEVTLNDQLKYGTQYFFRAGDISGVLSNATDGSLAGGFPGMALSVMSHNGNPRALLSALANVTNVRVLSSPQLMVVDGSPARLLVGNSVPYLNQTAQSTNAPGAPIVNSIGYRDTGIILDILPHIGASGQVTLDLTQEVSAVEATASAGGIQSPTFSKREIHSRVVLQNGQTVGLAGLISDNASRGNSGVPVLKDIPVLGSLFGTQNNQRQRTELLVLVTPHVVENPSQLRALTEDLEQALPDAAGVPEGLKSLKPSGSYDPNASLLQ